MLFVHHTAIGRVCACLDLSLSRLRPTAKPLLIGSGEKRRLGRWVAQDFEAAVVQEPHGQRFAFAAAAGHGRRLAHVQHPQR